MALIAGTGLAITVIVVLVRASYQLGKISSQANNHEIAIRDLNGKVDRLDTKFEAKFEALDAKFEAKFEAMESKFDARFDALTVAISQLQAEMQQTNQILVGLANHTHDADGRTVFTIPS